MMSYTFGKFCDDVFKGYIPREIFTAVGLDVKTAEDCVRESERWESYWQRVCVMLFPSFFIIPPVAWIVSIVILQDQNILDWLLFLWMFFMGIVVVFLFYALFRLRKVTSQGVWKNMWTLYSDLIELMSVTGEPGIMLKPIEDMRMLARDKLVSIARDKLVLENMSTNEMAVLNRHDSYHSVRMRQLSESLSKNLALLKRLGLLNEDYTLQSIFDSARAGLQKEA